jgi:flagellar assembly factor FliW
VDPFHVVEEFYVDIPDGDLRPLKADETSEMGVLAIVTLPAQGQGEPTVNLQGLIALNFREKLGRQIIIQDSPYGLQWSLDLQRLNIAS